jgi:hypothetical protein
MKGPGSMLFVMLATATLMGCSSPYYGYSQQEWNSLSEEEKLSIKKQYLQIVDSKVEQRHEDRIDARTQSVIDRGVKGREFY